MARIKRLTALALLASAGFCLWLLAPATFSDAHPQVSKLEKIAKSGKAAVCIWPEYYAISFKNPRTNELEGIDIDLARELAKELKAEIQWVETTFATFIPDLQTGKCDIGMFGLASSLARAQAVEFSRPYLVASSVGVTRKDHAKLKRWEDIDQKGIVVAVALGSVAEPLMRGYLKSATVLAVQPPATREQEVMAGRADILVTDPHLPPDAAALLTEHVGRVIVAHPDGDATDLVPATDANMLAAVPAGGSPVPVPAAEPAARAH